MLFDQGAYAPSHLSLREMEDDEQLEGQAGERLSVDLSTEPEDERTFLLDTQEFADNVVSSEAEEYNVLEPFVSNAVRSYLCEIRDYQLLSKEEEVAFARSVMQGKKEYSRMEQGEPYDQRRIDQSEEAKRCLTEANLRLVVSVAKKYVGYGLDLLDLIQEGNLGLMHAIDLFNPEKGYRFSTYAVWWIRQYVSRALANKGREIRIPHHVLKKLYRVRRADWRLFQELGREPTCEEVGAQVGLTGEEIYQIVLQCEMPMSMDRSIGEEDESVFGDFLEDASILPLPEQAVKALLKKDIQRALASLKPRECEVLQLRFGLQDGHSHTLEELAHRFQRSRQRIRQIEAKAMKTLRDAYGNALKDYLD